MQMEEIIREFGNAIKAMKEELKEVKEKLGKEIQMLKGKMKRKEKKSVS